MKNITYNTLKILLIGAVLSFSACTSGKMGLKGAEKKFAQGDYNEAIDAYSKLLKGGVSSAYANFQIAESYRLSNRVNKAVPYYKAAIDNNIQDETAQYYYGFALKANGDYDEAATAFGTYAGSGTDEEKVKIAQKEVENINELNTILAQQAYAQVNNLDVINTEAAEYAPVYFKGDIYFTSARSGGKIYKATGTLFSDIYKAKMQGKSVAPGTVEALGKDINLENINEGAIAFTRDGRTMVFARGNSGKKKGAVDVNLYISYFRDDVWTEPVLMNVNDPKAWDSTPVFSRNGKTLYFSSNRKGGSGGIDLYSSTLDGRGRWSNVKNMGKTINSAGDDMFPYVAKGGALYFSSSGHAGLGGLDLFKAVRKDGKTTVQNMGVPYNSSYDDFGMNFIDPPFEGYFTSNRDTGKGDDDIYFFVDDNPDLRIVNYVLEGLTVTTGDDGSEEILPDAKVAFMDANGEVIGEVTTGQNGEFKFKVQGERNYILIGDKKQYFKSRELFSTEGKSLKKEDLVDRVTNVTFKTKIKLDKIVLDKAIVLDNIYYDLDKDNIRSDAALELNKLVAILQDNPEIKIELSSHTDSRAPDDYNQDLSQRRAESAVRYIIDNGIESERITAKGYGETRLIVSDGQIDQLPNEEEREAAHQRNRRTEFKVTEYDPDKLKVLEEPEEETPDDPGQIENNEGGN